MKKLILFLLLVLPTMLVSCNLDDEPSSDVSSDDPKGTTIINLLSGEYSKVPHIQFGKYQESQVYIDEGLNFTAPDNFAKFVCVGKVKGLSKISSMPSSGWSETVAVIKGCGYVSNHGDGIRFYVENYLYNSNQEIIGAVIKYQTPFNP